MLLFDLYILVFKENYHITTFVLQVMCEKVEGVCSDLRNADRIEFNLCLKYRVGNILVY